MSDARRAAPLAPTLAVIALAASLALGGALWWAFHVDQRRLDEAHASRAMREAEVARRLFVERVERGAAIVRSVAASGAIREGLAEGSRTQLFRGLSPFSDEFGRLMLSIIDERERRLAWSSPLAAVALEEHDPDPRWEGPRFSVLGSDLVVILSEPVLGPRGDVVGRVDAAVQTGRLFVQDAQGVLVGSLSLMLDGELVTGGLDAPLPPPPGGFEALGEEPVSWRGESAGRDYDFGAAGVSYEGRRAHLVVALSRESLAAARGRQLGLTLGVGGASLAGLLVFVGIYLGVERQRARAERQRDAALEREGALAERVDQLAAVVHDIKAPLGGIQLGAENLLEEEPSSEERGALERIVETCERLNLYLVNVLTAARDEAKGGIPLSRRALLVPGLLEDVAERLAPQAERAGVRLVVDADERLPPFEGDGVLLERALVNLAANALAVAPPGSPVTLSARREGDTLRLACLDQGPGFSAFPPGEAFSGERPRVRDASFRSGSTGFGLFVVRRIAEAHGGRAEARHREERGAEVAIVLPWPSGAGQADG